MQPCNRIYYSTVHWRLNMFRMAYRSSSGALTVFTASGLHMHMVTGRSQVWVGTESYYNARIYEHSIYYLQCTDLWTFNLLSTMHGSMNIQFIIYNARIYEHSIYYLQCTDLWTFNLLSTMHGSMNIQFIIYNARIYEHSIYYLQCTDLWTFNLLSTMHGSMNIQFIFYNARIYEHSIYYLQCTDLWTFNLLSTSTTYFDKNSRFWEQNNRIIFGKILEEVTWWAIKIYNKGFQNFLYQNLLQWLNG